MGIHWFLNFWCWVQIWPKPKFQICSKTKFLISVGVEVGGWDGCLIMWDVIHRWDFRVNYKIVIFPPPTTQLQMSALQIISLQGSKGWSYMRRWCEGGWNTSRLKCKSVTATFKKSVRFQTSQEGSIIEGSCTNTKAIFVLMCARFFFPSVRHTGT